jgi:hypothetical protein
VAARLSYARFVGAQAAGDEEWMAKQLAAAKKYASSAADRLLVASTADAALASALRKKGLNTNSGIAPLILENMRRAGTGVDQRRVMAEGRMSADVDTIYVARLLEATAGLPSPSIVELFDDLAQARRWLAGLLKEFAATSGAPAGIQASTSFDVTNPHDQEETIDLYIRRASLPPQWKLSIVDAREPSTGNNGAVTIVTEGKHYRVRLAARQQTRVASVVVPVGLVGENTTARWAVEGRIGSELVGGMVLEVRGPRTPADSKLPSTITPGGGLRWAWVAPIAGALLLASGLFLLQRHRSRKRM